MLSSPISTSSSSSSNIRVVARIKPDSSDNQKLPLIPYFDKKTIQFINGEEYTFSSVLGPSCTQNEAYQTICSEVINDTLMQGFNNTIICYGQTNSGKTYTMMGGANKDGVIPHLANDLFIKLEEFYSTGGDKKVSIEVSFIEIYNEKLRDLLDINNSKDLKIRENILKRMFVDGLTEESVSTSIELLSVMEKGNRSRSVGSTNMNQDSSRSHSIFTVKLSRYEASKLVIESKIQLVDLAGSEQVKRTGSAGVRLEEAKSINLSLSSLGNVISALVKKKSHVPYRDSKLTQILQDSLGGTAKTCLICTLSSTLENEEETLSTLRFGTRTQTIKNYAIKNFQTAEFELKTLLEEFEERIEKLLSNNDTILTGDPDEELQIQMKNHETEFQKIKTQLQEQLDNKQLLRPQLNESITKTNNLVVEINQSSLNLKDEINKLVDKNLEPQILPNEAQVEELRKSKGNFDLSEKLKESEKERDDLKTVLSLCQTNLTEHEEIIKKTEIELNNLIDKFIV